MKLCQMLISGYTRLPVIIMSAVLLGACGGGDDAASVTGGTAYSSNTAATGAVAVTSASTGSVSSQGMTGSIGLSWTAPVARADGTPLSLADINGYRIYYGTAAGNYPNRIDVPDGTATSATVTGIPVGSYYLVMTTYDVNGIESSYSQAIRKTAS